MITEYDYSISTPQFLPITQSKWMHYIYYFENESCESGSEEDESLVKNDKFFIGVPNHAQTFIE